MNTNGMTNYGNFNANGSDESLKQAQEELKTTMNKASVSQMNIMATQAVQQVQMSKINAVKDLMNSTKEQTSQVRL